MCTGAEELRKLSSWEGKGAVSRQKLMDKLQSKLQFVCQFNESPITNFLNSFSS